MNALRQTEISFSRERWKKIKSLENKTNLAAPNRSTLRIGGLGDIFVIDDYPTACRRQQPSQEVKHRRLAATRGSHDGYELPLLNLKRHSSKRRHIDLANSIDLDQVLSL